MENNENNTKEVKSRAIKGEPALVHPCASQWRVSRVAVWQRFFEKRSCARWRISMILRVTGAIEERFRTALTIYRADTRINRQRCLFSYEMFAIPSSHETPAFTTSERTSNKRGARSLKVKGGWIACPSTSASEPACLGRRATPLSPFDTHTHRRDLYRIPSSDIPPPPNLTYSLPSNLPPCSYLLLTLRHLSIHITASATLYTLMPLLFSFSFFF